MAEVRGNELCSELRSFYRPSIFYRPDAAVLLYAGLWSCGVVLYPVMHLYAIFVTVSSPFSSPSNSSRPPFSSFAFHFVLS